MQNIPNIFSKLAGLHKMVKSELDSVKYQVPHKAGYMETRYHRATANAHRYFASYISLRDSLVQAFPSLYSEIPIRDYPAVDADVPGALIEDLYNDLEYIFEVRANSELAPPSASGRPRRIFISHGRSHDWREVQAYIERDLEEKTLELAQEANQGRTLLQKLNEESNKCSFAVIVMTGDDEVTDAAPQVRQNVMHEIGFFQGKYGLANVCLLHEEGTSIPTNIQGVVYIPFPKGTVSATFGVLLREVKAVFGKA